MYTSSRSNNRAQSPLGQLLLTLGLAFLLIHLGLIPLARADTPITVTTTDDELNGGGDCSLREAIQSANIGFAQSGCTFDGSGTPYIIRLTSGQTYTISIPGYEDANSAGDLDVRSPVIITPTGVGSATIDGNGIDRVLHIHTGQQMEINNVKISKGRAPDDAHPGGPGGGILLDYMGVLTMNNVTVSNNRAGDGLGAGGCGGGIYINSSARATLRNISVISNVTGNGGANDGGFGGGICVVSGAVVTLTNSAVSSNTTGNGDRDGGYGGGLYNAGTLSLDKVVIDDNLTGNGTGHLGGGGGGVYNTGTGILRLTDVTISNNTTGNGGLLGGPGGGLQLFGEVMLTNSIVSSNTTGTGGEAAGAGGGISIPAI